MIKPTNFPINITPQVARPNKKTTMTHLYCEFIRIVTYVSYGPPWAHYLGGYQDRLLGGPLGLPGLRYTAPEGVEHKD
jgi:hypothetical protein